ncbi:hypothetical protein FQN60_004435 [Etheostoma spectabile]|uniref:Uncharacterized protein n=1 Tax=Etheostoma spectabile TaxID=54343 RepID=A0A5J5D2H3_9PERO|nr:hypothetical protein FQN60_004435 [Etheostoma spectabile]
MPQSLLMHRTNLKILDIYVMGYSFGPSPQGNNHMGMQDPNIALRIPKESVPRWMISRRCCRLTELKD